MSSKLNNLVIKLTVSDPWEFCTENGEGPFSATIVSTDEHESILLKLENSLKYDGHDCEYFVASPRHEGVQIESLEKNELDCNMKLIPKDKAESDNPFDLSWWRGGLGLIATIEKNG